VLRALVEVQRIRKYLLDWNSSGHLDGFDLTLSVGISEWSDGKTLDEMLDAADRAMYAEKAVSKPKLALLNPVESPQ
jgi:GGDEF domain-containing protein